MYAPPADIPEINSLSWPANAWKLILDQHGEIKDQNEETYQLGGPIIALAAKLAQLRADRRQLPKLL